MEEFLITTLCNDGAVAWIVADRINFGSHPQGDPLPALVLNTVSGSSEYLIGAPQSLTQSRVQIDCYAEDFATAKDLSKAVINALSGASGGSVLGAFIVATRDGREGFSGADRPFRISLDFEVHFHR